MSRNRARNRKKERERTRANKPTQTAVEAFISWDDIVGFELTPAEREYAREVFDEAVARDRALRVIGRIK